MVDNESRLEAAKVIDEFKRGRISNFDFADAFPRSDDRAVKAIRSMLWFSYDDIRQHRLTDKWSLNEEAERLFDRCILFLRSDLEYVGEANFISIFAPFKRFWSSVTRQPAATVAPWWPFESREQMSEAERLIGQGPV